ncbi:MAG: cupin-like domain-containing protein [Cellvibrio sp.]|nr:cupin-like domain-containing protein [Cellvibrio sp.]
MNTIKEVSSITSEHFRNEIVRSSQPVVIRGLVNDWPMVQAAKKSNLAFCDYLKRFDRGLNLDTMTGPASIKGRIFYNSDLSGLNSRMGQSKLGPSLDYIIEHAKDDPAPLLAMQSVVISQYLPGLQLENKLHLLPDAISPRIWIGGKAIVAAHYDAAENIACCVAGKRKFTLFPPEQIANLYIGPLELTPAGATISMVDLENPDFEKYPNFQHALNAAQQAVLEPGDAIYIPYLWWHNVQALDELNVLINYWWGEPEEERIDPRNALYHAMMTIRFLPPHYREHWKHMFDHYVFHKNGDPGEHLPEERLGILSRTKPIAMIKKMRLALAKALSRT